MRDVGPNHIMLLTLRHSVSGKLESEWRKMFNSKIEGLRQATHFYAAVRLYLRGVHRSGQSTGSGRASRHVGEFGAANFSYLRTISSGVFWLVVMPYRASVHYLSSEKISADFLAVRRPTFCPPTKSISRDILCGTVFLPAT